MQDNLGGDFKEFQSAYEAVGTDLFDQQEGALRKLTQTATNGMCLKTRRLDQKKNYWHQPWPHCRWCTGADCVIGAIGLVAFGGYHRHQCHYRGSRRNGAIFTTVGKCHYDGHRGD